MPDVYTPVSIDFPLPSDIAAEIAVARQRIEAAGGTVRVVVTVATFMTWWGDHHRGRRVQSIEFTPELRMGTERKDINAALVCHHNERGRIWASADMVRRMTEWVLDPDAPLDAAGTTSPLTDAEIRTAGADDK